VTAKLQYIIVPIVPALSGTIYFKLLKFIKIFSLIKPHLPSNILELPCVTDEISHVTL
jgi:hypothetical protein